MQQYTPIDSLIFQNIKQPQEYLVFERNRNGDIQHLYRNVNLGGTYVPQSLTKIVWYNNPDFYNEYVVFPLIIIWLFVLILPFRGWVWLKRRNNVNYMNGKLLPGSVVGLAITVFVLFTVQFFRGFMFFFRHLSDFINGHISREFELMQYISCLFPFIVPFLLISCIKLWLQKRSTLFSRIYFSLFTIASVLHIMVLYRWHFIGLHLR